MTTFRQFHPTDLLKFNHINMDPMTETYKLRHYLTYLTSYPEYFQVAVHPNGQLMGYIIGRVGKKKNDSYSHGRVCALAVSSQFRRMGIARILMSNLEFIAQNHGAAYMVLFVRESNDTARAVYRELEYHAVRYIFNYYSPTEIRDREDAVDLRKSLPLDMFMFAENPLPHIDVRDLPDFP